MCGSLLVLLYYMLWPEWPSSSVQYCVVKEPIAMLLDVCHATVTLLFIPMFSVCLLLFCFRSSVLCVAVLASCVI
jgi:hypothetical protein